MKYTEEERAIVYLNFCTQYDYREKVSLLRKILKDGAAELEIQKEETDKLFAELDRKNYFAVTLASSDYPEALKTIDEPPLALLCAGNRELLSGRKFCIVGSRKTPSWAEGVTKRISEELSENFVIVTGLAEGGDRAAIDGALKSGNLISVLPCGLDECYPSAHFSLKEKIRGSGLLISEYPLKEKVRQYSFHERNRILAGLSEGVLVVSAGE
ncbi:MAG: DNA-protecting protein DprA, partial [Clostridia bacterium]|nr:DNA-protecting protein DprA [Clostridia bacterium]